MSSTSIPRGLAGGTPRFTPRSLGLGVGWRPELALAIDRERRLGFIELLAEDFDPKGPIPPAIDRLRERGSKIVVHGVGLSLGGADRPEPRRLDHLARLAERLGAVLISEHIAFVRAGGIESGHLLPVPRTVEALDVLIENTREAMRALPVPLALENIASLVQWPRPEMDEADFLTALIRRTGVGLLLDVANVYANARNHGDDPLEFLDRAPLDALAYVHVAGGIERQSVYHDTHTAPVPKGVLALLGELAARASIPGVLLERDDRFPDADELAAELEAISAAASLGVPRP
ncbi:MAG: DUF692 domain-containing protein [Isosphaeraceae bacterium]